MVQSADDHGQTGEACVTACGQSCTGKTTLDTLSLWLSADPFPAVLLWESITGLQILQLDAGVGAKLPSGVRSYHMTCMILQIDCLNCVADGSSASTAVQVLAFTNLQELELNNYQRLNLQPCFSDLVHLSVRSWECRSLLFLLPSTDILHHLPCTVQGCSVSLHIAGAACVGLLISTTACLGLAAAKPFPPGDRWLQDASTACSMEQCSCAAEY